MKKLILVCVILSSATLSAQAQTQEVLIVLDHAYVVRNAIDSNDIFWDSVSVAVKRHEYTNVLIIPGNETPTFLDQKNDMYYITIDWGKTYVLQIKNGKYIGPQMKVTFKRKYLTYPEPLPGTN